VSGLVELISRVNQIQQNLLAPGVGSSVGSGGAFAAELSAARSASSAGTGSSATAASRQAVVAAARRYIGVPYVFGGTNPATGLDCSGLVQRVYADLGIKLPRLAADQATNGTPVANLDKAKPGDLLAFNRPVDHIAIYIGDGKMIAAPQPGELVKVQDVYATPSAIRRIIPDAPEATSAAAAVRPATLTSATSGGVSGVPYASFFNQAGARHGVSAKLLAAVAKVESGYNSGAVSPAGAQGLMQLMPGTAAGLGVNPFDPAQAVDGAARILAGNLREFGSLPLALAAYNAGGGAVRRYGGIPPFAETRAYVPKVQAALAALG
jgi:soluble lytic murein transglycosylase-like protein